ncbi:MAG TPA: hypothetical protein VFS20_01775 [Longimicrobium sp.]|nr:hypothetical protein [Longimicrobium sp.]
MTDHDHAHEHDDAEETLGMALGFRIFEDGGELYWAEAEISPYQNQPTALGVTLVFQTLAGVDPTNPGDEDDQEPWTFDFDDELTRDENASLVDQTADILRQLANLSPAALSEYLRSAKEDTGEDEDE